MKTFKITRNNRTFKVRANDCVSALQKVIVKDAVSLKPGDWFTLNSFKFTNAHVYKVLSLAHEEGTFERYDVSLMFGNNRNLSYKMTRYGIVHSRNLATNKDIVRFNSSEEAIKWLQRQVDVVNLAH